MPCERQEVYLRFIVVYIFISVFLTHCLLTVLHSCNALAILYMCTVMLVKLVGGGERECVCEGERERVRKRESAGGRGFYRLSTLTGEAVEQ